MAYYLENYPRLIKHQNISIITYVIESWLSEELDSVESYIKETFVENPLTLKNDLLYMIAFAWRLGSNRMLDLWAFTKNHVHEPSGPLVSVYTFSEFKPDEASEIASGNTLLVLGLEEEYRVKCQNLATYFNKRPTLPDALIVRPTKT